MTTTFDVLLSISLLMGRRTKLPRARCFGHVHPLISTRGSLADSRHVPAACCSSLLVEGLVMLDCCCW